MGGCQTQEPDNRRAVGVQVRREAGSFGQWGSSRVSRRLSCEVLGGEGVTSDHAMCSADGPKKEER